MQVKALSWRQLESISRDKEIAQQKRGKHWNMAIWGDWKGKQLAISEISDCKKRV